MRTVKIQRQPNLLYKYHFYFEKFYSQENLSFLKFTTVVSALFKSRPTVIKKTHHHDSLLRLIKMNHIQFEWYVYCEYINKCIAH